jgi:hypothetical protein
MRIKRAVGIGVSSSLVLYGIIYASVFFNGYCSRPELPKDLPTRPAYSRTCEPRERREERHHSSIKNEKSLLDWLLKEPFSIRRQANYLAHQ